MPLHHRDLTDAQWATLDRFIPEPTFAKTDEEGPGKTAVLS
jgi:hypothetical protein